MHICPRRSLLELPAVLVRDTALAGCKGAVGELGVSKLAFKEGTHYCETSANT